MIPPKKADAAEETRESKRFRSTAPTKYKNYPRLQSKSHQSCVAEESALAAVSPVLSLSKGRPRRLIALQKRNTRALRDALRCAPGSSGTRVDCHNLKANLYYALYRRQAQAEYVDSDRQVPKNRFVVAKQAEQEPEDRKSNPLSADYKW